MTVLVVSESHLAAHGLAALLDQVGLSGSIASLAEAEAAASSAVLAIVHCERWGETSAGVVQRLARMETPVIVTSPIADDGSRTASLRAGALDFISSEHLGDLALKVRNLSRLPLRPVSMIRLSPESAVDTLHRRIISGGRHRALADTEFRLLLLLYDEFRRHPGQAVSPAALSQRLWGSAGSRARSTLRSHIASLRDKIEVDPSAPRILVGVRYEGYYLNLTPVPAQQATALPVRTDGQLL